MKRIGEILQIMADAPESEFERLIAEAMGQPAKREAGIAAGMSGRSTHPRAKERHCVVAKRLQEGAADAQGGATHRPTAQALEGVPREPMGKGESAGSAKPPASWEVGVSKCQNPRALNVLRVVVDNSRDGRAHAARVAPPGARPSLVLVWSEGHTVLANSP